ncbi:MAG: s-methyl-5-thioribose-1-phosphate isomerase, partial [Chloroflexi bacterium]|nr:s-methyl-5-thioribose-1-phosphate isomerase [Chloroflexota bacterium]
MPDPSSDPTISQAAPDAAEPAAPATVEPPPPAAQANQATDLGRRRFFRSFAGDVFQTAATMAGAAQALQRASAEAASLILNPDGAADAGSTPGTPGGDGGAAGSVGSGGFRTPFREDADTLYIVDQRRLPGEIVEYPCRSAGEVAFAIRSMVVRGAPAIGQVAAIGLALSAEKLRDGRPYARRATLRGSANALTNARPTVRNVGWAMDRVMARYAEVGELSEDGDAIADAIRAETDAIIFEATTDHGRMASFGAEILPAPDDRPLRILTHGTTGTLAGGQYGTALGIVQAAHHAGRDLHVWVDETRPSMAGARVTAWELVHADIPHTLLPDAAAGHLLARGEVDIVLVGADRVAANGDTANDAGTYALGVLAARHDVPLFVCAPLSTVDLE